jgi:hypothetical protein
VEEIETENGIYGIQFPDEVQVHLLLHERDLIVEVESISHRATRRQRIDVKIIDGRTQSAIIFP